MGQVGHADSKMTLDVYAQLEQRVDAPEGAEDDPETLRFAGRSRGGEGRNRTGDTTISDRTEEGEDDAWLQGLS
jgi:hypothetical protein